MKTNRTCITQHRNEATGHSFEVWEEVEGSIVPYVDGKPVVTASTNVTGGIVNIAVSNVAPVNADGRPDGTIYVQTV